MISLYYYNIGHCGTNRVNDLIKDINALNYDIIVLIEGHHYTDEYTIKKICGIVQCYFYFRHGNNFDAKGTNRNSNINRI